MSDDSPLVRGPRYPRAESPRHRPPGQPAHLATPAQNLPLFRGAEARGCFRDVEARGEEGARALPSTKPNTCHLTAWTSIIMWRLRSQGVQVQVRHQLPLGPQERACRRNKLAVTLALAQSSIPYLVSHLPSVGQLDVLDRAPSAQSPPPSRAESPQHKPPGQPAHLATLARIFRYSAASRHAAVPATSRHAACRVREQPMGKTPSSRCPGKRPTLSSTSGPRRSG